MYAGDIFDEALERGRPYSGRIAIISTLWNPKLVDQMVDDARAVLHQYLEKPKIKEYKVAGTIELAAAAHRLTQRGFYSAILIIGAVIRGETPHFDYVCHTISTAVAHLNTAENKVTPVIFGVLTVDNLEQAKDRVYGMHGHPKKGEMDAKSLLIQINFLKDRARPDNDINI